MESPLTGPVWFRKIARMRNLRKRIDKRKSDYVSIRVWPQTDDLIGKVWKMLIAADRRKHRTEIVNGAMLREVERVTAELKADGVLR